MASFAESLRSAEALIADPQYDLDRTVGRDRTALGEVLMVQGHNSYHLGQIVELRRQLGSWPPPPAPRKEGMPLSTEMPAPVEAMTQAPLTMASAASW